MRREDYVSHLLKFYRIEGILPWFHTPHHIFYVLSDLIGGLQTEEVKVPQQVVMEGEELEIQFGQCQAAWEEKQIKNIQSK